MRMMKGMILWCATTLALCGTGFGQLAFVSKLMKHTADPAAERFEVKFPFVNAKAGEVEVTKVVSTCGCLKAETDKASYAAGERGTVTGVFSLGSRTGTYEKAIMVTTDSEEEGVMTQELRVRVTMPVVMEIAPPQLVWDQGEEPAPKAFILEVKREEPIHVTGVNTSREGFECEVHEVERGRKYRIELTPGATDVPVMGIVRVETDCEIEKRSRQVVFFRVKRAEEG